MAGYALLTLEWAGWKADATTEAVVDYLLLRNGDINHWRTSANRHPSEVSPFTTTFSNAGLSNSAADSTMSV